MRDDEGLIATRYEEAESQARDKVAEGEEQAEDKRLEADREAEEESWWDKAVGFVEDAFDALTSFINDIFDGIRSFVTEVFDAVRDFAKGLIDLAADFVKGAITAFGEGLKVLVDATVGQVFPELAADLNAGIDGAVLTAHEAVDAVADTLKAGVDAVVDTLQKAVNFVINTFQAAVNTALAFMEATITGDWSKFARKLLESVLRLVGIAPAAFYEFIANIVDTVELIIDDPLGFLGNLVDAVVLGFQKFADNFLAHLQVGIIAWLTGALGDIQLPKEFSLSGVLDIARQILGLTWEWVRAKAVKLVGEKNVARLEFLFSYVQTLIEGGFPALWERISQDLSGLVDMVIGTIKEYLVQNVIIAGVQWIAALFTPVGALVKLVFTVWNLYTFVRDQFRRIVQIAQTVVSALGNIARGIIEDAGLRVESALANLLPVAIDLVAKLLGLGNVSARIREIIGGIRDWIDQAVNKLLDRVLKAFTGKGEPAAGTAGEVPVESSVGTPLAVDVAEGPDHTLTVAVSGNDATAMLSSPDPQPVSKWLDNFEGKLPEFDDKAEREDAAQKIAVARTHLTELNREADTVVAAEAGGGTAAPKAEGEVRSDQERLRDALVAVFNAFGGKGAAILDLFAAEIERARESARRQIRTALKENETTFQTMQWSDVRSNIAANYNPFKRPLLSDYEFGQAAQAEAVAHARTMTRPDGQTLAPADEKPFVSNWAARLINTSEDPPFAAARAALQAIIFENGEPTESPQFKAAVETAFEQFLGRGEQADPALKALVGGNIIQFLVKVATGEVPKETWETDYWGKPANRKWIKERFRAAGGGGKHEWIATSYVNKVLDRARESEQSGDPPTAARWIRFQNEFRSPTDVLFYPHKGRYERYAPYARDPKSHEKLDDDKLPVLQGHTGAVYAPVSNEGQYRDDASQQIKGQDLWHKDLGHIFDANPGADVATMARIIQQIDTFIEGELWFGKVDPKPVFNEYYAAASKDPDPNDIVPYETLKKRATEASSTIRDDFARAREVVGL